MACKLDKLSFFTVPLWYSNAVEILVHHFRPILRIIVSPIIIQASRHGIINPPEMPNQFTNVMMGTEIVMLSALER